MDKDIRGKSQESELEANLKKKFKKCFMKMGKDGDVK